MVVKLPFLLLTLVLFFASTKSERHSLRKNERSLTSPYNDKFDQPPSPNDPKKFHDFFVSLNLLSKVYILKNFWEKLTSESQQKIKELHPVLNVKAQREETKPVMTNTAADKKPEDKVADNLTTNNDWIIEFKKLTEEKKKNLFNDLFSDNFVKMMFSLELKNLKE
eukprot:GHVL01025259.1.p1 GENE.GHVL01025259.1~~GHVL01025259.1.p1  ORF type:complete len:166 (+),score=34.39 GHVL01025259.1:64-561(+)